MANPSKLEQLRALRTSGTGGLSRQAATRPASKAAPVRRKRETAAPETVEPKLDTPKPVVCTRAQRVQDQLASPPKPKRDRREYMRNLMRKRRAEGKA